MIALYIQTTYNTVMMTNGILVLDTLGEYFTIAIAAYYIGMTTEKFNISKRL